VARKIVKKILSILSLLIINSCGAFSPSIDVITGKVTDKDGKPVPNLTVQIDGEKKITDKDGSYRFEGIPQKNTKLRIIKDNTELSSIDLKIVGGTQSVDLQVDKNASTLSTPTASEIANLLKNPKTPSPSPFNGSGKIIKFKIKSGVIRGNGDIIPVARTKFSLLPYSINKLEEDLIIKNRPGEKPRQVDFKKPCEFNNIFCPDDTEAFKKAEEAWEAKAFLGRDEEIKIRSNNRKDIVFITDLSGEATVEAEEGIWFLSGMWSTNISSVFWQDLSINVNSSLEKLELSNDNATSIFNKSP